MFEIGEHNDMPNYQSLEAQHFLTCLALERARQFLSKEDMEVLCSATGIHLEEFAGMKHQGYSTVELRAKGVV